MNTSKKQLNQSPKNAQNRLWVLNDQELMQVRGGTGQGSWEDK